MNVNDPLRKADDRQRDLFERFSETSNGHLPDHVLGAAANLFVNALRQNNKSRTQAMAQFEEVTSKLRTLLAENYDLTGKRLSGVYPFHQTIEMPLFDARPRR